MEQKEGEKPPQKHTIRELLAWQAREKIKKRLQNVLPPPSPTAQKARRN